MKYYLVSDFRFPKSFDDLVYLTQIVQAECMREPVEHWRRNAGRCNGALYWQFNDCWPVSSWASVDYYGNYKALQYAAKRFNAPVDVSIENNSPEMVVHAVNESAEYVFAVFKWRVEGFDGEALAEGALGGVELRSGEAKKIAGLDFKDLLKTRGYNCVFVVVMESAGVVISRKTALFKKERKLELPKSGINTAVKISDGGAELTLTSKYYARYVRLEIDGVTAPFSDNFFDMLAGESRTVTIKIPPSWDESALYKALNIKTVADVEPAGEPYRDFLYRLKMNLKPINLIKKIIFAIGL
ncbi:MAG: hypothetical protein LBQ40_06750, partial [Clostridiales bacterium]|jgi:beta-mannosidase|nr:hypothetical protein [Clostridiales bacterium]